MRGGFSREDIGHASQFHEAEPDPMMALGRGLAHYDLTDMLEPLGGLILG